MSRHAPFLILLFNFFTILTILPVIHAARYKPSASYSTIVGPPVYVTPTTTITMLSTSTT
ncbi:hypothetical protein HK097_002873, partial [Rhizophlyctis rosea]